MARLTVAAGSAHAPDDPFGREVLVVSTDGSFTYTRERGGTVTRRGRVDPGHVERLVDGLRAAGYPRAPRHDIPPGASLVQVALAAGPPVDLDLYAARGWPGYGPVLQWFEAVCAWLRRPGSGRPPPAGLVEVDP